MLKIRFSAKLSLKRISKRNTCTDWHHTNTSCFLISLLSGTIFNSLLWLDFLSNWSCCSHNLLASKKTDLNQESSPITLPFDSPLSARCRQVWLWFWLCTVRVLRMCSPHKDSTSTTDQPSGPKWRYRIGYFQTIRKRDFQNFWEIFWLPHSVFKTLSGFRAYSHSVSFLIS